MQSASLRPNGRWPGPLQARMELMDQSYADPPSGRGTESEREQLLRVARKIWAAPPPHRRMSLTEFHVAAPLLTRGVSRNQIHTGCRRQHSPTVALVDQGPGPARPGGACPPFAAVGPLTPKTYASQVRAP